MRTSTIKRKTKETDVIVTLGLDGATNRESCVLSTGIGFFDHMLSAFQVHSGFDLRVQAAGDLQVDAHHTVEDVGIALGMAIKEALGDKSGIRRYGSFFVPMDEALAFAAIDISGRPFLVFQGDFHEPKVGDFDVCLCEEFFRAFAAAAGVTLHIKAEYGGNAHHLIEAIFKAAAHAIRIAAEKTGNEVLSSKGVLD